LPVNQWFSCRIKYFRVFRLKKRYFRVQDEANMSQTKKKVRANSVDDLLHET